MDNPLPTTVPGSARNLWLRLSIPVALAMVLTTLILFLPVWAAPARPPGADSGAITLWLNSFNVQAQGGLTITKVAVPATTTIDQGKFITYTLTITNGTGEPLNSLEVIDFVPANTSCKVANGGEIFDATDASNGEWSGNQPSCDNGKAKWTYLNLNNGNPGGSFENGETVSLSFRVAVAKPLPNKTKIINGPDYQVSGANDLNLPPPFTATGTISVVHLVNAPEWVITKTVSPSQTAKAGQNITYTITVTNVGNLATDGPFTITDTLSTHLDPNSVSATEPFTNTSGTLTWVRSNSLTVNSSLVFTVVATVDSPITNGTKIINSNYLVSGGSVYSDAVGQPVTVTVDSPVTLTVKKTAAASVEAGDLLTYTIAITNDAASLGEAAGLVFTDAIPANTVYKSHGFSGTIVGNTPSIPTGSSVITWTLNKLDIGDRAYLTMTVQVKSPLISGTVITNSEYGATLSNTLTLDPPTPVTSTVTSRPIITMSKTVVPTTVVQGGQVTYTIIITNSGNETAVDLPFTDTVDSSFTPVQATWSRTITGTDYETDKPGVVNYTLVMTAGTTPGQFGNYLTTTVGGTDITVGPVATVTVLPQVDLEITKARLGSNDVVRGDLITYTLTITNHGPETADARITDTFTNVTYTTRSSYTINLTKFPGSSCKNSPANTLACDIKALTGTTTITVVLDTATSVSGTITNTAVITTGIPNQGDKNPGNNSDEITTPVRYPIADLQISKTRLGSGEVLSGNSITYTLTITNAAGSDMVDAVVTDTFTGTVTSASGSGCTGSGPIVCSFNDFTQTKTITVVLKTKNSFSGTLTNTAEITFASSFVAVEEKPADNTTPPVTATVRYPTADLELSKTQVGNSPVIAGGLITYTIAITNNGPDTLDATITDTFTGTATVENVSPAACSGSGPIVCGYTGFTGTEIITVVLRADNSFSGTLTNTARIAADNPYSTDPPGNNSDTVTTTVRQLSADLEVTKFGPTTTVAGNPVTYTVVITNPGDAVNVVVTDTFTYGSRQSATATSGGSCSGSGPIGCSFSNFAGVATITVVLNTPPSVAAMMLNNSAVITLSQPNATDPNPGNNDSNVTTTVRPRQADLQIEKTLVGSSSVLPGSRVTYTLQITNSGPDVVGATLNDTATPFLAVKDISINSPSGWSCSEGINTISCNNPQFGLETQTFTVVLTTSASYSGQLINKAAVAPASPAIDPSPDNNNDEVTVTVGTGLPTPLLTISKTASPGSGSNVLSGQTIRYQVTVTNSGTGAASIVTLSDDLTGIGGVTYVSGSGSSNGTFIENSGRVTASLTTLDAGKTLTATWQVRVTAATSGTLLSNSASASSATTPLITSPLVTHTVITASAGGPVFLPIISKNCCFANLVITKFSVTTTVNPPIVSVEVTNQGLGSTGGGFWVDLYVNPEPLPVTLLNAINPGDRRWQRLDTNVNQGIAWEIKTALAPGASIVLTQASPQINTTQTRWTSLPAGTHNFYAFADSYDANNNRYVEINEGNDANEQDNQAGPLVKTVSAAAALDTAAPATVTEFPPRRNAGQK